MSSTLAVLADLGELSKLPLELMFMVMAYFDVPTAARFTQVNRQARFLLWSDKDYRLVQDGLFSELRKGADSFKIGHVPLEHVSYQTLAHTISVEKCTTCGLSSCGGYLDLSMGHAYCGGCLSGDMRPRCVWMVWIKLQLNITKFIQELLQICKESPQTFISGALD
ncbi:hypothetical protein F5Y12DRAFT_208058 [Xylaria sp. FL1777]|nr:hypothetical protein F5Y12DRAFT_208058 [Xylaria sp. FL1777]